MVSVTVTDDAEGAARACAEQLAAAIAAARAERGAAHISLAGGRTPARAYELLTERVADWRDVHLWFGDERCVPLDDPDSNCWLVERTLLAALDAAGGTSRPMLHPVALAGAGDPAAAADAYATELRATVPADATASGKPLPVLDLALLGLGEDGHTASLFPNDAALDERERLCVPVHGSKPPFERVSLTLPVLRAARRIVVLTAGAGKAWAVGAMLAEPSRQVPASLLAEGGTVELIADREAAPA